MREAEATRREHHAVSELLPRQRPARVHEITWLALDLSLGCEHQSIFSHKGHEDHKRMFDMRPALHVRFSLQTVFPRGR
jgi:hypothetical protein